MTQEDRDKILDVKIDAAFTVRNAPPTSLVSWALTKVNGMSAFDPDVVAITNLSKSYPGSNMNEDQRIEIVQKLKKVGIDV